jgi:hypothetical protein
MKTDYDDILIEALRPLSLKIMKMCKKGCCYDEEVVSLEIGETVETERYTLEAYDEGIDYRLITHKKY